MEYLPTLTRKIDSTDRFYKIHDLPNSGIILSDTETNIIFTDYVGADCRGIVTGDSVGDTPDIIYSGYDEYFPISKSIDYAMRREYVLKRPHTLFAYMYRRFGYINDARTVDSTSPVNSVWIDIYMLDGIDSFKIRLKLISNEIKNKKWVVEAYTA